MAVVSEKRTRVRIESLGFLRDPALRAKLDIGEVLIDLNRAELDHLAAHLKPVTLDRNAVLFREGDIASCMGMVLEGKLHVHKRSDDNINKSLYVMTPGKVFGEMALLDGEPRSATLVAGEPTLVALLSREAFDRLCRERPAIALKIMLKLGRLLSQRLRRVTGLLVDHLP